MSTVQIKVARSTVVGRQVFELVDATVQDGVIVAPGGGSAVVVINKGVATLARDALVYVSGVTAGVMEVQLADANVDDLNAAFYLPSALLVGETGIAYRSGLSVATLNTNAGTVNDPVYLSETAGCWTLTAPTAAGSRVEQVGVIAVKSAGVGQIMWSVGGGAGSVGTNELQDLAVTDGKLAGSITRANLVTEALAGYGVRVQDVLQTTGIPIVPAETAGNFNLSLAADVLLIQGEISDNETELSEGNFQFRLPAEYVDGGSVTVTLPAAIVKTGAAVDNASTLDLECFKSDGAGAVGADIVATAAETFAAVDTWYDKAFTITPASLVSGDLLNFVVTASIVDSEGGAGTLRLNMEAPQITLQVKG